MLKKVRVRTTVLTSRASSWTSSCSTARTREEGEEGAGDVWAGPSGSRRRHCDGVLLSAASFRRRRRQRDWTRRSRAGRPVARAKGERHHREADPGGHGPEAVPDVGSGRPTRCQRARPRAPDRGAALAALEEIGSDGPTPSPGSASTSAASPRRPTAAPSHARTSRPRKCRRSTRRSMTSPGETKADRSQAILGQLKRVVPVAVKRPVQRALPDRYKRYFDPDWHRKTIRRNVGHWDYLGKLQLDYLVERGLEPQHHLLDVGCGPLRRRTSSATSSPATTRRRQARRRARDGGEVVATGSRARSPSCGDRPLRVRQARRNSTTRSAVGVHYLPRTRSSAASSRWAVAGGKFYATIYENPHGSCTDDIKQNETARPLRLRPHHYDPTRSLRVRGNGPLVACEAGSSIRTTRRWSSHRRAALARDFLYTKGGRRGPLPFRSLLCLPARGRQRVLEPGVRRTVRHQGPADGLGRVRLADAPPDPGQAGDAARRDSPLRHRLRRRGAEARRRDVCLRSEAQPSGGHAWRAGRSLHRRGSSGERVPTGSRARGRLLDTARRRERAVRPDDPSVVPSTAQYRANVLVPDS